MKKQSTTIPLPKAGRITDTLVTGLKYLQGAKDKAVAAPGRLIEHLGNKTLGDGSSRTRVLLERLLPGLDEVATSSDSLLAGGRNATVRDETRGIIGALTNAHVGAAPDTLRVAGASALDSLKKLKGAAGGSGVGAIAGGATAEQDASVGDVIKRILTGAAVGGGAGVGGMAAARGIKDGGKHYLDGARAWTGLARQGILSRGFSDAIDVGSFNLLKTMKEQSNHRGANVSQLTNRGASGGYLVGLGKDLRAAKVKSLNFGTLVNPRMGDFMANPGFLNRFKKMGIEDISGNYKHNSIIDMTGDQVTGATKFSDAIRRQLDRMPSKRDNTTALVLGKAHANRQSTPGLKGLIDDLKLKNRKANLYKPTTSNSVDRNAIDKYVARMGPETIEEFGKGLSKDELRRFMRAQESGIVTPDRLYNGNGINNTAVPFNINLKELKSLKELRKDPPMPVVEHVTKALRAKDKKYINANPRLRTELQEELISGKKNRAKEVAGKVGEKSVAKRQKAVDDRQFNKEFKQELKQERAALRAAVESAKDFKPKKNAVWDLLSDEVNEGDASKVLVPFKDIEKKLGISKEDLLEDSGVSNVAEWEVFKKLLVSGHTKSASFGLEARLRILMLFHK